MCLQDAQTLIGVHPQLTPVSSIKAGLPAKLQLTKQTSTAGVASHASVAAVPSSAVPSSSVPSSAVPCGAGNDSAPKVRQCEHFGLRLSAYLDQACDCHTMTILYKQLLWLVYG